jgi:hypothetical protein
MTLARIITHSDLCARELAFHLLGRGYAVEIVSPDSIPDNFADLELRVDADSGDQLVTSLAAYEAQRVSTPEFVARVKAPKDGAMLAPPEVGDEPRVLDRPAVINVAPTVDDTEAPADSSNGTPQPIFLWAEDAVDPEARPDLGSDRRIDDAAQVLPGEEALTLSTSDVPQLDTLPANVELSAASANEKTVEPLSYFVRQTSSIALPFAGPAEVLPTWEGQTVDRPVEWKFIVPAALTLTAVLLLSLFLAFGVRASAKPSVGSSAPARTAVASANASSPVAEKVAATGKPDADLHIASRPNISRKQAADLVAPDTVTYLDGRYEPAAKPNSLHAKESSIRRARGDVAADTTTRFNSATSPQPAK